MAGRKPKSRRAARDPSRSDEWGLSRAAEFVAHAYGWGSDYIESRVTDEQLVAYLDAAQERLRSEARARSAELVDAVRAGWIFAHDEGQYDRWRSDMDRRSGVAPTGRTLHQLVSDFGDRVVAGVLDPALRN